VASIWEVEVPSDYIQLRQVEHNFVYPESGAVLAGFEVARQTILRLLHDMCPSSASMVQHDILDLPIKLFMRLRGVLENAAIPAKLDDPNHGSLDHGPSLIKLLKWD